MSSVVSTGSATTKDWRAATKDVKIGAYLPGDDATMTPELHAAPHDPDERTKIDMAPEEALGALLKTQPKRRPAR